MTDERDPSSTIAVSVVYATASIQDAVTVTLAPGATVADAIAASGLPRDYAMPTAAIEAAIGGKRVSPRTRVVDGDRVDVLRALVADPKSARIRRAGEHALPRATRRKKRDA